MAHLRGWLDRAAGRPASVGPESDGVSVLHDPASGRRGTGVNPKYTVALDRSVGRLVYKLHGFLYKRLDGRGIVSTAFGLPVVLLTTTGRKSGQPRTTPLLSYPVDGTTLAVVASNGGRPETPQWYLNLQADPKVQVQRGRRRYPARARVADEAERESMWPAMTAKYKGWAHYETLTDRPIPVVLLSDETGS